MTEAEWLACDDPNLVLEDLEGRASARKLRLFACAYCRATWDVLTDQRLKALVRLSEGTAETADTEADLHARWHAHFARGVLCGGRRSGIVRLYSWVLDKPYELSRSEKGLLLIREVFGNPFRKVRITPVW